MEITKKVFMKDRNEWRKWLEKNHSSVSEIWLVFYKKHSGKPSVRYDEAVEEALCYGWIDGIAKSIDGECYAQRFTPRKNDKNWSELNKSRVAELIKNGKMTSAGMEKFNYSKNDSPSKLNRNTISLDVSSEFLSALKSNSPALAFFNSLAPTYRKQFVMWINSAKREETKLKRIKEAVDLLKQNKKLGLK